MYSSTPATSASNNCSFDAPVLTGGTVPRPELEIVTEQIGSALLTLDESLRAINGRVEALGGAWASATPEPGRPCEPRCDNALSVLRDHRDSLFVQMARAKGIADRLNVLV